MLDEACFHSIFRGMGMSGGRSFGNAGVPEVSAAGDNIAKAVLRQRKSFIMVGAMQTMAWRRKGMGQWTKSGPHGFQVAGE